MRRIWCWPVLLAMFALAGCQLTREPKPPRAPEEFRAPPDEVRYQTPNFYPNNLLNQDSHVKMREEGQDTNLLNTKSMGRGMGGMGSVGGVGGMGGPGR